MSMTKVLLNTMSTPSVEAGARLSRAKDPGMYIPTVSAPGGTAEKADSIGTAGDDKDSRTLVYQFTIHTPIIRMALLSELHDNVRQCVCTLYRAMVQPKSGDNA